MYPKPKMWMRIFILGFGLLSIPALAFQTKSAPDPTATETPSSSPECDCHYAVHIIFDCAGQFSLGEGSLGLSIIAGESPGTGCEPVVCEDALARCTLSMASNTTKSAELCQVIPGILVAQLTECLGSSEQSRLCVKPDTKYEGGVFIEASEPFYLCLCSDEMGVSCNESMGVVLGTCPVYNLLDGIGGNEVHDWREFQSGVGIEVNAAVCPEVFPTDTPTNTPVPTSTPTNTERTPPDPTLTPTPAGECVCEYAGHLIFSCTGQFPVDDGTGALMIEYGAYEGKDCEPAPGGDVIAGCTLSLNLTQTKSANLCEILPGLIADQWLSCFQERSVGTLCIDPDEKDPGALFIMSSVPFHVAICSSEAGVSCNGSLRLMLGAQCPVFNLFDGIDGNETHDVTQFKSGIGIEFQPITCSELEEAVRSGITGKTSSIENWLLNK